MNRPARRDFDIHERKLESEGEFQVLSVDVRVPENLVYFEGHFPGDPILPGVAQMSELVVPEALAAWPELGRLATVRRLKFVNPIRPKDRLTLQLSRTKDPARVSLTILRDETICTSASLGFEAQS